MKTGFKAIIFSLFMFSAPVFAQVTPSAEDGGIPKKKEEFKIQEIITTDSLPPEELAKRAAAWVNEENLTYVKSGGSSTGSKVECVATFSIMPKELNPKPDYTGKFTMNVVIECKDSRYRYTISQIKHISKKGDYNGGDIGNSTPECGSMIMDDIMWKKLKGEATKRAYKVAADLKAAMAIEAAETKKDDDW
ncbi:MAG: hypothetical protein KF900_03810 [Bacteroidetes bacterium]|nr:hypothetical protein [Bacteroidota bacterium]